MKMMINGKKERSNLKAVIFDYGEVLCLAPTTEDIEGSARILGISPDSFRELWGRNRDLYDRGDLSAERYWSKFAEDAGTTLDPSQLQDLYQRDVTMWSRLNPDMVGWLSALSAAGMKTAVLSNMHMGMVQHARHAFQWLDSVNFTTLSAEVRLIKPDPAIYEHCLRGLDVAPSDALFIDDREVNVAAARAMGIDAVQFESLLQLRNELQQAGFPVLPLDASLKDPIL
jgi:putative hydrolase of the HAD superfamily